MSEVSARFTLDALPGKQMAIDADLNAGLMTADEAKVRRQDVATEADFYGSMDGASKFVKGDAVAGVLILVINIVGGMVLGIFSHGLSAGDAAKTYVLLAIGDALVAQVPALLLSIAAAAIVTRVSSTLDLARQVTSQFGSAGTWAPVGAILGVLGLLPGMPHFIILPAAAGAGLLAWRLHKKPEVFEVALPQTAPSSVIEWSDVHDSAALSLDIGYALVGLVDERKGAPLMARITGIRRQLSRELGFVVPLVRVRDELSLAPNRYRITLSGIVVGEDDIFPDDLLALDSGDIERVVEGRAVGATGLSSTLGKMRDRLVTGTGALATASSRYERIGTGIAKERLRMEDDNARLVDRLTKSFGGMDRRVAQLKAVQSYVEQQVAAWNSAR